jgi:hypothetical protein
VGNGFGASVPNRKGTAINRGLSVRFGKGRQRIKTDFGPRENTVKALHKMFPVGHFLIGLLFIIGAFTLIGFAGLEL